MKLYLLSLALGVLVGVIYGLVKVRSPAPPLIALIGLLGMLAGEQIPPLVKRTLDQPVATTTDQRQAPPAVTHTEPKP